VQGSGAERRITARQVFMITVADIFKSYGSSEVLRGVSFRIEGPKIAALIGPSGSGKSTLLKILAGVISADQGEVQISLGAKVSFMFQEGALFDSFSVFDNVAFPLVRGKVPAAILPRHQKGQVAEKVFSILDKVGLGAAGRKYPAQLSGGMKRRLSLARALVTEPDLLFLDDPTFGLDPVASSVILDLIVKIQQESQGTVIIASHDLRRLLPISEKILALFEGRIVFEGTLEQLRYCDNRTLKHFVECRFDLDQNKHDQII